MPKASRSNRGSTPDIERMDWRTPIPLVRAIESHYAIKFVMDAAASPENAICKAYITKGMDTLNMSMDRIYEVFLSGLKMHQAETVHPIQSPAIWCNPEYNSSEDLLRWIEKSARFSATFRIPWVFILPSSRTEQDWFQASIGWAPQYAFTEGRVPYNYPDGTPGPSPNHPSVVIGFNAPQAGPNQVTRIPNTWKKELVRVKRPPVVKAVAA